MRWLAAAAGELHRILLLGGSFLNPADRRRGYEGGRLRLTYAAMPIAFLIEHASNKATNGQSAILNLVPHDLHENTALIFGAADDPDRVHHHLSQAFWAQRFGGRFGLPDPKASQDQRRNLSGKPACYVCYQRLGRRHAGAVIQMSDCC